MSRRRVLPAALGAVLLGACFGPDPDLTDRGLGRPQVSVEFPATAPAGSTQDAVLHITNPGPGDMERVVVAFGAVGEPDLPPGIVRVGSGQRNAAIVDIEPSPQGVSQDAVVYTFGAAQQGRALIPEGASFTVTFELKLPEDPGRAANSIVVYAGDDTERARGIKLETMVKG